MKNWINKEWQKGNDTDDFGVSTESTFEYKGILGTLNVSDYIINDFRGVLRKDKTGVVLIIVDKFTGWYRPTYQIVKVKTPSGKIVEFKTYCSEDGKLNFPTKQKYNFWGVSKGYELNKFEETLKEKGDYILVMNYKGEFFSGNYTFKFNI